jgi:thiol-disulfide isomerase/thioredoxin
MKKAFIIILCLFGKSYAQPFLLKGKIFENDTGYVLLQYRNENNEKLTEVCKIVNGSFTFKGNLNAISDAILATDSNYIHRNKKYYRYLYIEPGNSFISFINGSINAAKYQNLKTQSEYDILIKSKSKEIEDLRYQDSLLRVTEGSIRNGTISPKNAEDHLKTISNNRKVIYARMAEKELDFIKQNPDSYVCLTLIKDFVDQLSINTIDSLYNSISQKTKGSSLDFIFLEYYKKYRAAISEIYPFDKLELNQKAPDFLIYQKGKNEPLTHQYFEGKIVLLEFWGLNCLPCLRKNPLIENIRKRYSDNQFVVIGIISDKQPEIGAVIKYIKKNRFTKWLRVAIDSTIKKEIEFVNRGNFSNYKGLGIPRTVLINKKGEIIYTSYGFSDNESEELIKHIEESK